MAVLNKQQYEFINGYRDLINLAVISGEVVNKGRAQTLLEYLKSYGFGDINLSCNDCIFAYLNLCDRLLKQYESEKK